MSANYEPNPPSRREEDFPKTNTIPNGWVTDALMEKYNPTEPVPATGKDRSNGRHPEENTRPAPVVNDEGLFARRLDPFPAPNTIPSGWDLSAF
jgi:hypothetical protein